MIHTIDLCLELNSLNPLGGKDITHQQPGINTVTISAPISRSHDTGFPFRIVIQLYNIVMLQYLSTLFKIV